MNLTFFTLIILLFVGAMAYRLGKKRAQQSRIIGQSILGLPRHYGMYAFMCTFMPGLVLFILWSIIASNIIDSLLEYGSLHG